MIGRRTTQNAQKSQRRLFSAYSAGSALIVVILCVGCGKKGPPLAPLIRLPAPPPDLTAARRGETVDLSFTVPNVNTDGTRPANVAQADVYAITAPVGMPPLSDANIVKYGTKVGSVEVKAPKDPNLVVEPDDPADEVDEPEGRGLEQGAPAHVTEDLTDDMLEAAEIPPDKNAPKPPKIQAPADGPLLGPPPSLPVRTYAAFGLSKRGRKGPLSKRVTVPLVLPPPPPSGAAIAYDEKAITLTWRAAASAEPTPSDDLLPARTIGPRRPGITYHVYDSSKDGAAVKLTKTPLDVLKYTDTRMVWGEKRCYTIVSAVAIGGATIESNQAPPACETPVDTFAPAAPKDLKAISSEGAINLIWEPNAEKDLAGYLVLRGVEPAETLQPLTPAPIVEPSFKDQVKPDIPYVYAIVAVDKAGNRSPASARVVETAR